MLLCIVCGIASIALVAVGVSKYAMFAIVIVVIGLGSGGVMTLIPNTSMQVFGEANFDLHMVYWYLQEQARH